MEREQYIQEAFQNMARLGPGSTESTNKALNMIKKILPSNILDLGCGVGTHTFLLAERFPNANITAIDLNPTFIEELNKKAKEKGIGSMIHGVVKSMFEMTFSDESFDLIWAEGSIYIAGFKRGINDWKRLLKPNGYLICSEISWLKDNPSEESYKFWHEAYPDIDTIDNKLKQVEEAGYIMNLSYFICPITDWTENYYNFLQNNLDDMRTKYKDNEDAALFIGGLQSEIDLYNKFYEDYSYVFYAMQRS